MDFLFHLPKTRKDSSAVLVVVDTFSKQVHFSAVNSSAITAKDVADSSYREVFKRNDLHGTSSLTKTQVSPVVSAQKR